MARCENMHVVRRRGRADVAKPTPKILLSFQRYAGDPATR